MIRVCLTHDVDRVRKTYQYLTKPLRMIRAGLWRSAGKSFCQMFQKEPYWGFDEIMEIEEQHGVRSTFFFLDETIPLRLLQLKTWKLALGRYRVTDKRVADIIRRLDKGGWEIGLHGSYRSYQDINLLRQEKQRLEQVVGHEIIGIRQHYLNLAPDTWQLQSAAGFRYDSSWGYIDAIGFREGKVEPFHPLEDKNFVEIPLCIMDSCYIHTKNTEQSLRKIAREADKKNAVIVINFHSNNFNPIDFPYYKESYIYLIEYFQKLDAEFLTMQQAYSKICAICPDSIPVLT